MINGSSDEFAIPIIHDFIRGFKAGKADLKVVEHANGDVDYIATNEPKRPVKFMMSVHFAGIPLHCTSARYGQYLGQCFHYALVSCKILWRYLADKTYRRSLFRNGGK